MCLRGFLEQICKSFDLKPKPLSDIRSVLCFRRNRLESNSEHWNALLLSLRELTEWIIRKDTELSTLGIGPLRGDAASLQKQLVSSVVMRQSAAAANTAIVTATPRPAVIARASRTASCASLRKFDCHIGAHIGRSSALRWKLVVCR